MGSWFTHPEKAMFLKRALQFKTRQLSWNKEQKNVIITGLLKPEDGYMSVFIKSLSKDLSENNA